MLYRKVKVAMQLLLSTKATALPVSFLMLFVSLTLIVSATYYISVSKIQARGALLNVAVAKQSMLALENSIGSTAWSPGTSNIHHFENSGGILETHPTSRQLLVNVTDETLQTTAFNGNIGKAVYKLPSTEIAVSTFYMKGDRRVLINESALSMAQLYLAAGETFPEVALSYRPLATVSETGFSQGKPVNTLRLYVINLNASTALAAQGEFSVKSTCINVTSNVENLDFSYQITSIFVKAFLDGTSGTVTLPISSNANGALVRVETLVCNIKLERTSGGS